MRKIDCAYCHEHMELVYQEKQLTGECAKCQKKWSVYPIHPDAEPRPVAALLPQPLTRGQSSCYNHPENTAQTGCEACGRLVCAVCECDLFGRSYCPACWGAERPHTWHLSIERLNLTREAFPVSGMNSQTLAKKYFTDSYFVFGINQGGALFGPDHLIYMEVLGTKKDYSRIGYRNIRFVAVRAMGPRWFEALGWLVAGLVPLLMLVTIGAAMDHGSSSNEELRAFIMLLTLLPLVGLLSIAGYKIYRMLLPHFAYAVVTDVQSLVFLISGGESEPMMINRFRERIAGAR